MKKIALIITILTISILSTYAQRFAYVDTKYILDKMPEYKKAQATLDEQAAQWQKELDNKSDRKSVV